MFVTGRDVVAVVRDMERKTTVVCGDDGETQRLDLEDEGTRWAGGR